MPTGEVTLKIRRDLSYCHDRCPQLQARENKCRLWGKLKNYHATGLVSIVGLDNAFELNERHVDCLAALGEEDE